MTWVVHGLRRFLNGDPVHTNRKKRSRMPPFFDLFVDNSFYMIIPVSASRLFVIVINILRFQLMPLLLYSSLLYSALLL